jgi:hypothetical protein
MKGGGACEVHASRHRAYGEPRYSSGWAFDSLARYPSSTCAVQGIVDGMFREDPMQHSLAAKVSDELVSGIPCPPPTKGRNN